MGAGSGETEKRGDWETKCLLLLTPYSFLTPYSPLPAPRSPLKSKPQSDFAQIDVRVEYG